MGIPIKSNASALPGPGRRPRTPAGRTQMRRGVGLAGRSAAAALRQRAAAAGGARGAGAGATGPMAGGSPPEQPGEDPGEEELPQVRVRAPAGAGAENADRLELRLELAGRTRTLLRPNQEPLAKPLAKLRQAAAGKKRKPAKKNRQGSGGEAGTPGTRRVALRWRCGRC